MDLFTITNNSGVTMPAGSPITADGLRGSAATITNAAVIGLTLASCVTGAQVIVQPGGLVVLSTAAWDALTGGSGGLVAGTVYVLSTTAGMLATVAPSTQGQAVTVIGRARDATSLVVEIAQPVLL